MCKLITSAESTVYVQVDFVEERYDLFLNCLTEVQDVLYLYTSHSLA